MYIQYRKSYTVFLGRWTSVLDVESHLAQQQLSKFQTDTRGITVVQLHFSSTSLELGSQWQIAGKLEPHFEPQGQEIK